MSTAKDILSRPQLFKIAISMRAGDAAPSPNFNTFLTASAISVAGAFPLLPGLKIRRFLSSPYWHSDSHICSVPGSVAT